MSGVPKVYYRGSEDPTCERCFRLLGDVPLGYVQRVPGGYRYRLSESEPWSTPCKLKHLAAFALLAANGLVEGED